MMTITNKIVIFNKSKRKEAIIMNHVHVHSLAVRLNKETDTPEIYCHNPKCCFRENYDSAMVTHRKLFDKDVANLLSKEKD